MFSYAMTHPNIMESYCTSPETEKKKREREREKKREKIYSWLAVNFLVWQTGRMVLLRDSFHSR